MLQIHKGQPDGSISIVRRDNGILVGFIHRLHWWNAMDINKESIGHWRTLEDALEGLRKHYTEEVGG